MQERKRNVLVLINNFLVEAGYIESAGSNNQSHIICFIISSIVIERFQHEAGGAMNKFVVADNIDLGLILSEYEAYVSKSYFILL